MKLEKSIVFHSPNQIWLRCYSATVSAIRSISPIFEIRKKYSVSLTKSNMVALLLCDR
nr:MAG TPA: hypothetical protein [Caudoviricetes sp.]DAY45121.1 MAG TPA: hypothetical protein [Caudoviricetes sp.]